MCTLLTFILSYSQGAIESERHPLLGWFTLRDLAPELSCLDDEKLATTLHTSDGSSSQVLAAPPSLNSDLSPPVIPAPAPAPPTPTVVQTQPTSLAAASQSDTPQKQTLSVGTIVNIQDRTWPGRNDPGGVAVICGIHHHHPLGSATTMQTLYDVKYVLESRKEKGVEECFVRLHDEYTARQPSAVTLAHVPRPLPLKRRVTEINSRVPTDVEFLVVAGKVFARYRTTHEPFDPLALKKDKLEAETSALSSPAKPVTPVTTAESKVAPLTIKASPKPPVPMTAQQLEALLKLLGPRICSVLPWLRIPFQPQRVFAAKPDLVDKKEAAAKKATTSQVVSSGTRDTPTVNALSDADDYLKSLTAHHKATAGESTHSANGEINNPILYNNAYRRAPSVYAVQSHHGPSFQTSNILPDMHTYPTKVSGLSLALPDLTLERSFNVRMPFADPVKGLRDRLVRLERSLNGACLLDVEWESVGTTMRDSWRRQVDAASSMRELARLLVSLVDAACFRLFVPQWYLAKEEDNGVAAGGAGDSVIGGNRYSSFETKESIILQEDWSPKKEILRRQWDRTKDNGMLWLLLNGTGGNAEDAFWRKGALRSGNGGGKRGKKSKKGREEEEKDFKTANEGNGVKSEGRLGSALMLGGEKEVLSKTTVGGGVFDTQIAADKAVTSGQDYLKTPNISQQPKTTSMAGGGELAKTEKGKPSSLLEPPVAEQSAKTPQVKLSPQSRSCTTANESTEKSTKPLEQATPPSGESTNTTATTSITSTPAKTLTKTPKISKSKKKLRGSAPLSSRRRSDRLNIIRQQLESIMGITPEDIDAKPNTEKAVLELKLEKLEKILTRDGAHPIAFFNIAGAKLFEPDGSLSPKVVRRVGRRAGGVRAPSLSYDTTYEVGETAVCHRWRKRTMACNTFEGLLHSFRFLDAHLDKMVRGAMIDVQLAFVLQKVKYFFMQMYTAGDCLSYKHCKPIRKQ